MSGWLIARAGLLPLLQSRVSMVYYVLLLLRCFSCSHTVLPKEHSLGVIFFSLHSSCLLYFSSIQPEQTFFAQVLKKNVFAQVAEMSAQ